MKKTINIIDHYVVRPASPVRPLRYKTGFACKTILALCLLSFVLCPLYAQNDSELNRSVTVERDFQPEIQAAGKVATKPAVQQTTIEPTPVEYSTYTVNVAPEASINPMLSQPTRFEGNQPYSGYIRGGLGHPNTLFDFGYHVDDGKKSILDLYAHHKGDWCDHGRLSKTKIGLGFAHTYSTCDVYFGLNGGNIFYHKYGDYWSDTLPKNSTTLWTTEVYLGVRANAKQDVQYNVQVGYELFTKPDAVSEHHINTKAFFDWHADEHHVGMNLGVQNSFMQLNSLSKIIPDSLYNSRHNLRIEPYYAYRGRNILLHVGVNLDMNIGCGQNSLSGTKNITFAPSPHISFEAQIAQRWLTVYADAKGELGRGTLQEFMETNRYRLIHAGITEHHAAPYTPVDAEVGLRIRPHRDLFIEVHGGYALMLNQENWIATTDKLTWNELTVPINLRPGEFGFFYANYNRGKIGAEVNYHYRDIVRVNLNGDYFIWKGDTTVYDRPAWKLGLRVDGRIDKHWSLYSENLFEGSRTALVYTAADDTYAERTLKPCIDLNLGVQYEMWVGSKGKRLKVKGERNEDQILRPEPKPNLTLFLQLNNFIHRKNAVYYQHHEHGINFTLGATYRF